MRIQQHASPRHTDGADRPLRSKRDNSARPSSPSLSTSSPLQRLSPRSRQVRRPRLRDIAAACAHARVALRVVVMHRDPIDATASRVRQQAMVGAALLQAQLVRDNLIVLASELAEVVILQRRSPRVVMPSAVRIFPLPLLPRCRLPSDFAWAHPSHLGMLEGGRPLSRAVPPRKPPRTRLLRVLAWRVWSTMAHDTDRWDGTTALGSSNLRLTPMLRHHSPIAPRLLGVRVCV